MKKNLLDDKLKISVVIPSLGGEQLYGTLLALLGGFCKPDEVIVCLPPGVTPNEKLKKLVAVKFINSDLGGQVPQRAEGFRIVRNELVLQLDDDIILEHDSLLIMKNALISFGNKNAIGPMFINRINGLPITSIKGGFVGFFVNIYEFVIRGLPWGKERIGSLSRTGAAFGVVPRSPDSEIVHVDWLAGGCVLSYKADLVLTNFYPYKGKAYSEDLIHSIMRTRLEISHLVASKAIAGIDAPERLAPLKECIKEIRARLYVVSMLNGSKLRGFLSAIFDILRRNIAYVLYNKFN